MSRSVVVDFRGIEKEQAHATELAPAVPAKADYLTTPILAKNIPIVKREFPSERWVNWGINPEKPKFPYNPANLRPAKAGQPDTWGELSSAVKNVKDKKALGIGFQFNGDGLWGVDLDHAIDPESRKIELWAREIISELDTYTEISPSGTGFHLIARAPGFEAERHKKAVDKSSGVVEMYGTDRYFTITANIFDGRDKINERGHELLSVYNRFLSPAPAQTQKSPKQRGQTSPEKYLKNMLKDPYCLSLWNGERPNGDESKDDFALMCKLLYWTNRDTEKARELFLSSPHTQGKDAAHTKKLNRGGAAPYLPRLIEDANNTLTSTAAEDDKQTQASSVLNTGEGEQPDEYPDIVTLKNGATRPAETLANFKVCLAKYGVTVGYNCLSREIIPPRAFRERYTPVAINTALLSHCQDLCAMEQIPKTRDRVAGWLSTVANENRVHPVQRYLERLPEAHGTDEIKRLFGCLELTKEAPRNLSYKLLRKWLVQCVAMSYNDSGSYGGEGVLVLQGSQGIGKTSFFRALCKGLKGSFKEGAEQNSDKDKLIENTKYWITELGELERSTLKEMGTLKAFITNGSDEYRAPYGTSSVKYPRFTSFCGTVNDPDFLKEAGRRFWVIPLEDIDLEKLGEVDVSRVWAEALSIWRGNPLAFRLTKEEAAEVIKFSGKFEKVSTEETTLRDMLDFSADRKRWSWKTASELSRQLGLSDTAKVGRALRKIGYERGSEERPCRLKDGRSMYLVPPPIQPQY